jgi:hypothetical protein
MFKRSGVQGLFESSGILLSLSLLYLHAPTAEFPTAPPVSMLYNDPTCLTAAFWLYRVGIGDGAVFARALVEHRDRPKFRFCLIINLGHGVG